MATTLASSEIQQYIYFVRGQHVLLDSDLAKLYELPTKVFNQAVKRNHKYFPNETFMFQMTPEDLESLKTQILTLNIGRGKYRKHPPRAFTVYGAVILPIVLRSQRAVEINIAMAQAFIELQQHTAVQKLSFETELSQFHERLTTLEQQFKQQLVISAGLSAIEQKPTLQIQPPRPQPSTSSKIYSANHHHKIEAIQNAVADYFCLTLRELKQTTRKPAIALPRQITMYLIRKRTQMGLREIGKHFGGKDHTTVLHACQQIEEKLKYNVTLQHAMLDIEGTLRPEK